MGGRATPPCCLLMLSNWQRQFAAVGINYSFLKRYVDDFFMRIRLGANQTCEDVKALINSIDGEADPDEDVTRFQVDVVPLERDGTLAFLDCEFYEETDGQGRRVLSWRHYRKETSGIHVVPWRSAHTQVQKENYISSEVLRICKTCKYTKDTVPHIVFLAQRCIHAEYPIEVVRSNVQEGLNRWKGILKQVRLGRRPKNRSRPWRLSHPVPSKKKKKGVPVGVPGHKFVFRIPYRNPRFKRKVKHALCRAGLSNFHVMEVGGTSIRQLLCPGQVGGRKRCTMQNCLFCAGREDDPKRRRACRQKMSLYKVTCKHCNQSYVGQTVREVRSRILEHHNACTDQGVAELVGENLEDERFQPSAVGLHHHTEHPNLQPVWEFEVLGQASTVNQLDAMEHAHQLFGDYSINRRIESNGVR